MSEPKVLTGGFKFTIKNEGEPDRVPIPVDVGIEDVDKPRRGRPRKDSSGIVRTTAEKVEGTVEETPTMYTYMETTNMLRETLAQIDGLNKELMQEFTSVRSSRTMKNKYQVLNGLSENVGVLLSNKIRAISEINSSITKSNDLDYKKIKDRKAIESAMDEDKYITDLYRSFIQNPNNVPMSPQLPQVDPSIFGSGVVRAELGQQNNNGIADASYLNYLSNLSPEQNLMRYEDNPNVKQVVVFDAATGNRFFQMMDLSTNTVIPNVPVYDEMFLEDTTLDLQTKIAKNINLNETFPIVVINEGVTKEY